MKRWQQNRWRLPALAAVLVFGGLGIYFLRGSHALVVNDAGASITLAPETAQITKGDYINVAVNIDTNGQVSDRVKAVVSYPSQSLHLEAVRQACPKPDFGNATQDTTVPDAVTVECESPDGVNGRQTIAYLVFKAVADSSDAALAVGQESTINRKSDDASLARSVRQSHMTVESVEQSAVKRERVVKPTGSKLASCALPAQGDVRCRAKRATELDGRPLESPNAASVSGYGPKELHQAYQVPCTPGGPVQNICATPASFGPASIAITDAGAYTGGVAQLEKDFATYNQQFGIPPCTIANGCLTVMDQRGSTTAVPTKDLQWAGEIIMDVVAAHTMCQTCKVKLILSDSASTSSLGAANKLAASLKPVAISDSWGGGSASDEANFNNPGVLQFIADGDDGILPDIENAPSDYPSVINASGTTLKVNTDGTWASETVWSGSGGGCSPKFSAPAWQTALPNWSSVGCGGKRAYGDMSADADPSTGIAVYQELDGAWYKGGGTSLSAPLLAGIAALGSAIPAATVGGSVPYANNSADNFRDVTSGNDCTSTYKNHCTATAGFDVPSGLGSPKGIGAFKTSGTTPTPTPPTPTQPTPTPPTPTPPTPTPPTTMIGDLNGDGKVSLTDLSKLLSAWNTNSATADINKSGKVDITDLSMLLSHWTG